jgi:hypothetical protein
MKLKPELFFPTDENGIIFPPCILKCHDDGTDYNKIKKEYEQLPTTYKSKVHQHTSEYLACIIGENYQIMFRNNGKIVLSCNFKQDKDVSTIEDLLDYGVVL